VRLFTNFGQEQSADACRKTETN